MVELSKLANRTGKINQMLFLTLFTYIKKIPNKTGEHSVKLRQQTKIYSINCTADI